MSYVMEVLKNLANKIVLFLIQEISTYLKILSILKTNGDLCSTNILAKWPEMTHERIVQALGLPFIYQFLDLLKSMSFIELILVIMFSHMMISKVCNPRNPCNQKLLALFFLFFTSDDKNVI